MASPLPRIIFAWAIGTALAAAIALVLHTGPLIGFLLGFGITGVLCLIALGRSA